MKFRQILVVTLSALAVGCGGGSDGGGFAGGGVGGGSCTVDDEKTFVLNTMRDIWFWNTQLPADVDLSAYATAEELLVFLTSFEPLDRFSFIDSAAADAAFFNEGEFVGFGFTSSLVDEATNDVRFLRVFSGSPAAAGGLSRGQRLLQVDGVDVATLLAGDGLGAAFGPSEEGVVRTLRIRNLDNSEFDAVLTKTTFTIDPVPQTRTYTIGGSTYGYLEFSTFISTANDQLDAAFADFNTAGITDLIIDLRYNGGGRVDTAEFFGDLLGGFIASGQVFSETRFNEDNEINNRTDLFQQRANSLSTSRLVFITTGGSASASELVINSLEPVASVDLVGSDTFGKPVGQIGATFCNDTKILRPTAFETVNSLGQGQYFDGLPVDCQADDDFTTEVGSQADPSTAAALELLSTGACPVVSAQDINKPSPTASKFRPPAARNAAEANAYVF
ncbi:MAG: S41 family peptidase [Pseudomonadota bacterium]